MERKRIAGITPEQAARMLEATEAYERSLGSSAPRFDNLPGVDRILFRNDSGEEIPPYALMHITGTAENQFNYVTVTKPASSNVVRSKILVNGPEAVADGGFGTAQSGPIFRIIHDAAIMYEPGDRVGYKNNSFLAGLNPTFLVLGNDDLEDDMIRVMYDDSELRGVAATTITATTAGDVTVTTPTTRTHKAKTIGSDLLLGTSVRLGSENGEWTALGVC
jgi:hypothetical protein